MKAAFQIDLSFEQVLAIVKQLPKKQKIKLSKALEKDVIDAQLTKLLKSFKTSELDEANIEEELEKVRQELYDKQKR